MDLWYAAYGSNMARERLGCYLAGGCPPGAARVYPGARDRTLPRDVRPVRLAGEVFFAWQSPTWGGGSAFYDPDPAGGSAGVAYLVTLGQLSDIAAQEMHREPGTDLDLAALWDGGRQVLGPGRYESLHVVGRVERAPVVTFTSSWSPEEIAYNPPVGPYLSTMARGLAETHAWSAEEIAGYLLARPGIGSEWDEESMRSLVEAAIR